MMRVGIDASPIVGARGGVGVVTHHLIDGLLKLDTDLEVVAYVPPGSLREGVPAGWPASSRLRWVEAGPWQMAGRGKRDGLDLFHGTNFKMRTTGRFGGVVTIHDLWLDRYPAYSTKLFGQRWSFVRTRRTARRARKVVTVSTHAAGEIEALYGLPRTHLRVVPNGVAPEFTVRPAASTIQAVLQRLGIGERPYVLFVGGADPRKNHRTLIKAFARALPDVKGHLLVLVGDAVHRFGNYHESVRAEGVEEAVRCPGRVSFEDLRALYAGAALFAFPSRYEGFGMPVLEAMACRVPVITSNTTSLPEVAGEAAMLVNPLDDKELGEAMVRVLSDQKLAEDLRTKGMERAKQFTWERTARRTFAVYREVVEQG